MADKVKLSISPAVAAFVRQGTSPEIRLSGCLAAENMHIQDRLMLLFCLSKDKEPVIRSTAHALIKNLPDAVIEEYKNSVDSNKIVLDALISVLQKEESAAAIEEEFISSDVAENIADISEKSVDDDTPDSPVKEDEEEYLSKYKTAQLMGIAEKIKMALSGDKEWRSILVKDSNKLVSGSVIKNPRITEAEIQTLIKSGSPNDEIMRLICANKEWIKNYQIRKTLIENNKTPIQNAIRYLGTMGDKDMASFAKSKNISSVISTMAKRLLLNKKR